MAENKKIESLKDALTNFIEKFHQWIIYAGIMDKDCKEVCAACKTSNDDYRERIYNFVFRAAKENVEKINDGFLKSVFLNYETFNILIVSIEKDFSLFIMTEKDFTNMNMIYDIAKDLENKTIKNLEVNRETKEVVTK